MHGSTQEAATVVELVLLGQHGLLRRAVVDQPVLPFALALRAQRGVERMVRPLQPAVHVDHVLLGDLERGCDLLDRLRAEVALLDRLHLALQPAQVEEQLLLRRGRAQLHQRPGVQDVFLDGGADPPHGVGGEPEAAVGVEALDRLHQADIALGDDLVHRQAVAAVAHGDLGHQAQMAGHQLVGRLDVVMVAPALGEHVLLAPELPIQLVGAGAALEQVVAVEADQRVVAGEPVDLVGEVGALLLVGVFVVAVGAGDDGDGPDSLAVGARDLGGLATQDSGG